MRLITVQMFTLLAIGVAAIPVSLANAHTLQARTDSDEEERNWRQSGGDRAYNDFMSDPELRQSEAEFVKAHGLTKDDPRPRDVTIPPSIRHRRKDWEKTKSKPKSKSQKSASE
ncbi:hypothetical protein PspLS_01556 [Pyricularia sp. CBS 133598]|nr:hypothetical protein PspLS_01556 [Pyricularia sp. CBS 133598]